MQNNDIIQTIEIRFVLLLPFSSPSRIWKIWTGSDTFRSDQDQTCPPCCRLWGGDFVDFGVVIFVDFGVVIL